MLMKKCYAVDVSADINDLLYELCHHHHHHYIIIQNHNRNVDDAALLVHDTKTKTFSYNFFS